jgi:ribosomal protein L40E
MTDIPLLERLRLGHTTSGMKMLGEAADTIETQAAEIDFWKGRMREALKTIKENVGRIAELEQVSAMVCERCGWAMKFPGEECRNCAYEKQSVRIAELEKELDKHRQALAFIQSKAQDTLRPIPFQDEDE